MILPTKHIPVENALLGVGASLLGELTRPRTVTALWERVRHRPEVGSFLRFTLALDLLFAIGAVELQDGLLKRTSVG